MIRKLLPLTLLFGLLLSVAACKKEINSPTKPKPDEKEEPKEEEDSPEAILKDTLFYYTKVFSLWEHAMPPKNINDLMKKGDIRQYTKSYDRAEDVLSWMLSLTPIDPNTGKPIDRYSYLDRQGTITGMLKASTEVGSGASFFFLQSSDDDKRYDLSVRIVEKGSSAYEAGLRRGHKILSINRNTSVVSVREDADVDPKLNEYLNAASMKLKFKSPTGQPMEAEVTNGSYEYDPLLDDRVIELGDKKVGYLAFNSFEAVYDVYRTGDELEYVPTAMHTEFERIFTAFEAKGISELVVDLRYNGGGAVQTAEYLANRLTPKSADKELMFTYEVNALLEREGWREEGDEFADVYFKKEGNIDLERVYFLVTNETASASELLMNVLRPYMDVQMIGTYTVENDTQIAGNTFGKPVGFFGIPIIEKDIELFVSSFKMFNAAKVGNYFEGLKPSTHLWEFRSFYDFGDEKESMLAAALQHIKCEAYLPQPAKQARMGAGKTIEPAAKHVLDKPGDKRRSGMYKYPTRNLLK